jgi:hypothetical protein
LYEDFARAMVAVDRAEEIPRKGFELFDAVYLTVAT